MRTDSRRRLVELFDIQSKSRNMNTMLTHMKQELINAGCTVRTVDDQLFARKGTSPDPIPYIVAHADTVHAIVDKKRYATACYVDDNGDMVYYAYDPTTNGARGIGGDDKVGLWVAIEAAYALDDVGVVITVDEEIGALGAISIDPAEFDDAAVLIEVDRKGGTEAIYESFCGEMSSQAWRDHVDPIIASHGLKWSAEGTMTDVTEILDLHIADVSVVNLAAGYYGAHTSSEVVYESEAENAMHCAIALAQASAGTRWTHTIPEGGKYGKWDTSYTVLKKGGKSSVKLNTGWDRSDWDTDDEERDAKEGDVWFLGSKVLRKSATGEWEEVPDDELETHTSPLNDENYVTIYCEAKDCTTAAYDWHPEARASLCIRHSDSVDMALDQGADLDDVIDMLGLPAYSTAG